MMVTTRTFDSATESAVTGGWIWVLIYFVSAGVLQAATLATFDGSLGRVRQGPAPRRPAAYPPVVPHPVGAREAAS
jgi:hypothetical protein